MSFVDPMDLSVINSIKFGELLFKIIPTDHLKRLVWNGCYFLMSWVIGQIDWRGHVIWFGTAQSVWSWHMYGVAFLMTLTRSDHFDDWWLNGDDDDNEGCGSSSVNINQFWGIELSLYLTNFYYDFHQNTHPPLPFGTLLTGMTTHGEFKDPTDQNDTCHTL